MLILDDAATSQQVAALLPSSETCAVVVTSRTRLDGLRLLGFASLVLRPFEEGIARELLFTVAEELDEDPAALTALVELCDGLPLALHVAAVQLATGEYDSTADYVSVLSSSRQLLKRMKIDDNRLVEAVFEVFYRFLPEGPARAYRLLGTHFGVDFGIPLAAKVRALSESDTRVLVNKLVASNLLNKIAPGRFAFHSLIRQHARDVSERLDSESARLAGLGRGVDWHLHRVLALTKVIHPDRPSLAGKLYENTAAAYTGDNARDQALADLDLERPNFRMAIRTAAQLGEHAQVCQLNDALSQWYYQSGHREDRIDASALAAVAAEASADLALVMNTHKLTGIAAEATGEFSLALEHFGNALRLAEDLGDLLEQQSNLEWSAIVHEQVGDFLRSLELHARAGMIPVPAERVPRSKALRQLHSGRTTNKSGSAADIVELVDSLDFFASANEHGNAALVRREIAIAHKLLGDFEAALSWAKQALEGFEAENMLSQQVETLELLATLLPDEAVGFLQRAAEIYDRLGLITRAEDVRRKLTE